MQQEQRPMTSRKPYLLRAMIEWCEDNGLTPLVAVNAQEEGVSVPRSFVEDGRITLNVNFSAMKHREISNEYLSGEARFGGRAESLLVPMKAIEALLVRETGEGMVFPQDENASETALSEHLKDQLLAVTGKADKPQKPAIQALRAVDKEAKDSDGEPEDTPPRPPRGRPSLKIVK